jgi:putative heme iron utilization protein
MNLANEARQFLRSTRSGMLSTLSTKFPGYPFGSVAPFVLDHNAQPIILISTLAEHTHNIAANPKVSMLVFAGAEDLQANSRLTLIGEATKVDKSNTDLSARYLRYLPQAASYFDMHDFSFYRIQIAHARYIAGFGRMGWIDGEQLTGQELATEPNQLAAQETGIIEHMNADHHENLIAYCKHFHDVVATEVTMLGIDCDGFDVDTKDEAGKQKTLRFNFETPISDANSARKVLVAMAQTSRS